MVYLKSMTPRLNIHQVYEMFDWVAGSGFRCTSALCLYIYIYFILSVCHSSKMPLGPFGEVVGTTATLEALGPDAQNYKTKVVAPRNPKLVKANEVFQHKVTSNHL